MNGRHIPRSQVPVAPPSPQSVRRIARQTHALQQYSNESGRRMFEQDNIRWIG